MAVSFSLQLLSNAVVADFGAVCSI